MKARGNGKAATAAQADGEWRRMDKRAPFAKGMIRKAATGLQAWNLTKWRTVAAQADAANVDELRAFVEMLRHDVACVCLMIDEYRMTADEVAKWIHGDKPQCLPASSMGGEMVEWTTGNAVAEIGKGIAGWAFRIPRMIEDGEETPDVIDLPRFDDMAVPIAYSDVELPEDGQLDRGGIWRVTDNAVAAFVRLLEVCKRTHTKCAADVEELEIDIEEFNAEFCMGFSQALLDIRKRLLADFRRVRVALADFPTDRTGADAGAQADGTAGALAVLPELGEKVDALINRELEALQAHRKRGKMGAKAAQAWRESRGISSQCNEIYKKAKGRIDKGEKTDAVFARVAADFHVTAAKVKSIYYRKRGQGKGRGKYKREGKKRGRYGTIGHAKR